MAEEYIDEFSTKLAEAEEEGNFAGIIPIYLNKEPKSCPGLFYRPEMKQLVAKLDAGLLFHRDRMATKFREFVTLQKSFWSQVAMQDNDSKLEDLYSRLVTDVPFPTTSSWLHHVTSVGAKALGTSKPLTMKVYSIVNTQLQYALLIAQYITRNPPRSAALQDSLISFLDLVASHFISGEVPAKSPWSPLDGTGGARATSSSSSSTSTQQQQQLQFPTALNAPASPAKTDATSTTTTTKHQVYTAVDATLTPSQPLLHINTCSLFRNVLVDVENILAIALPLNHHYRKRVHCHIQTITEALPNYCNEIVEYHLCILRSFVLPDLEAVNWGAHSEYFKTRRVSNCLSFLQFYWKTVLNSFVTIGLAFNVIEQLILHSLSIVCARYTQLSVSQKRTPQFLVDVTYLTLWTRMMRRCVTTSSVQVQIEQTLMDLMALACLWCTPFAKLHEHLIAIRSRKDLEPQKRWSTFVPAWIWEPEVYNCNTTKVQPYYPLQDFCGSTFKLFKDKPEVAVFNFHQTVACSSFNWREIQHFVLKRPEFGPEPYPPLQPEIQDKATELVGWAALAGDRSSGGSTKGEKKMEQ
eukprot:TRINITY_DN62982_c0_g1_i1.p1 TRINITY_DN62982_c0_g1~~TRINITY_DN62982_c0_g1_i1.p1  ORF type:complete len:595 (-),score=29.29 TRINITY_DN62982_c0_g1_i1:924-2663(-)